MSWLAVFLESLMAQSGQRAALPLEGVPMPAPRQLVGCLPERNKTFRNYWFSRQPSPSTLPLPVGERAERKRLERFMKRPTGRRGTLQFIAPAGFAQKILGGHRPPLQLRVRDCRGAL